MATIFSARTTQLYLIMLLRFPTSKWS